MKRKSFETLVAALFLGVAGAAAMAQAPYNPDINGTEITNFNHFLDNHPKVAQRLAANPSLVNNPQFLSNHQELQNFLNDHPGVNQELHQTPGQFMYREGHYEWNHGGGPIASGPGTAAGPVSRFDNGYLDEHPDVAHQLAGNPHLADNAQFLATHPGLDGYLSQHPEVRQELQLHPGRFMSDEWRNDLYGQGRPLANTDHYMDTHPAVAQQLENNPALVNNKQYVDSHPGLHEFPSDSSDRAHGMEVASLSLHEPREPLRQGTLGAVRIDRSN